MSAELCNIEGGVMVCCAGPPAVCAGRLTEGHTVTWRVPDLEGGSG